MSDYTGDERRTDCLHCSGYYEQLRCLKESETIQWNKIDKLSEAIGAGKNWIIGILVGLSLNLITALITAGFVIAKSLNGP
jgi:hypothetical protein